MSGTDVFNATAIAGRVTTLDLDDTSVANVEIVTKASYGNVTVNPDNSLALVLTGTTETADLDFVIRITHNDGTSEVKTVAVDVVEGTQQGGWGIGDHYMLETDSQDRIVVEQGENHRKVYVSGSENALTFEDIAARENLTITDDSQWYRFLQEHPEYGATEDMAVAEEVGDLIWRLYSGAQNTGGEAHSNWLLFERGYTYSTLRIGTTGLPGESEVHPIYIGAYGEGEDPNIAAQLKFISPGSQNVVFQDLNFTGGIDAMRGANFLFDHVTVSDEMMNLQNLDSVTLRNSTIYDVFREEPLDPTAGWSSHSNRESGIYVSSSQGILLENSFFDHNGWADDYREDMSVEGGQPRANTATTSTSSTRTSTSRSATTSSCAAPQPGHRSGPAASSRTTSSWTTTGAASSDPAMQEAETIPCSPGTW
ncbi:hypothetical protein ACFSZS_31605 [Seohaeicola zhoushanensis]